MDMRLMPLRQSSENTRRRLPRPRIFLLILLLFVLSACASNAGIFGGGSWQAGALQKQDLQVIAVDPNHLRNIYAGDTQEGVFASTDAGATWKQSSSGLPLPVTVHALSFDIPGKRLYAATSAGLFASSDSAHTWSAVASIPADTYTALAFDVNSPRAVYAGTMHSGVLKSTDAGVNWARINDGLPTDRAIISVLYDPNLQQLWVAFTNTLYRSDDGGASWHIMNNGIPDTAGINVLTLGEVTSGNGGLIFAGTEHGFFRSIDAGQHWAESQLALSNLHVHAVLVDVTQPSVVYAATNIGVLLSQDNGQNWAALATGLPHNQIINGLAQGGDNYSQLFAASRGIYLYPGNSGGLTLSRGLPIILILLFFFLLYFFFVRRRSRPTRRFIDRATLSEEIPQAAENGHVSSSEFAPYIPKNEKEGD